MSSIEMAVEAPPTVEPTTTGRKPSRLRMPLVAKLGTALIGLVTLVLLINGGVNLWLNYGEAKRAAVRVQGEKAQAAAERVNEFVSEIESQIGWTTRAEWRRVPLEQQRYDFIRLLRQAPAITEVSYLDPAGKEQLKVSRLEPDQVGSGRDFSNEARFRQAVAEKVWFGPVYFRRGSEPYMTVAVAHTGRNPGVTTAEVNLKLVWDVITAIKVGEKGYAFVVTAGGRLIAHPDLSLVLRDTDLSQLPQVAGALAGGARSEDSTATIVDALDGTRVLSAHAPISRLGWLVFVQMPVEEALAPVYASLLQTAALLALGVLLATIVGTLLARRMVVPIRRLQAGAEQLGAGDLSQRIEIRTGDEIEMLAGRFNVMAERVQESYETLEAKVEERTRELAESLEYQMATSEVLGVISRSPSQLQPVLDAIVETAARLCNASDAVIWMKDAERLRSAAHWGPIPLGFEDWQIGPGWTAGRAMLERAIVHVPDLTVAEEFPDAQAVARRLGHRTIVSVPLISNDGAIGVLTIRRQEVRPFSEKQLGVLQTFADQAVIAISNVGLFEEVQARTRELTESLQQQTATSEVLQAISRSTFNLEVVLDTLAQSAARLCDSDIGTITRQRNGIFYRTAMHGFPPDFARKAAALPVAIDGGTVTGRALRDGVIVHIHDVLADPEYTWAEAQAAAGYRTLLGVPLLREGTPIGAFALGRRTVQPYTERQIELVKTFADQAVIAIENARLFEEVQARTRELTESLDYQTATSEVLGVISRSTADAKPVFEAIVRSAARLFAPWSANITIVKDDRLHFMATASSSRADEEVMLGKIAPIYPIALDPTRAPSAQAIFQRRIVEVLDSLAPETPEFTNKVGLATGFRSLTFVPLLLDDRGVGTIILTHNEPGQSFTAKQQELIQTFADQAVIAIENARLFNELTARTRELQASLDDLRRAQDRLIQSEKLASLGQLTAGIAHEIKNPLNFVNNFSALSTELIDELREALGTASLDESTRAEVDELAGMLKGNLEKVVQHGKRADSIVKNMLLHSREGSGERRIVSVNGVVEESMNLAYHGARAEKPGFNVTLRKQLDPAAGEADLYPQEITRVLLNLFSNGFYAATKRKAELGDTFEPTITAATRDLGDKVEIRIRDNGTGIAEDVRARLFSPFFTTKPAGEGTGLGLSLSHDIVVKQHGGTIEVASVPGEFTEFTIVLPRTAAADAGKGRA